MKFTVTYAYNVRRFVKSTIEAESTEQAIEMAKSQAQQHISEDNQLIENSDQFGTVAGWDAFVMIDHPDGDAVSEISLPELDEQ